MSTETCTGGQSVIPPLPVRCHRGWCFATALLAVAGGLIGFSFFRGQSSVHDHGSSTRNLDPETSCGPVSLAVVSEYLGRPVPIATFHEATSAGELEVCSMADLLRALRRYGFSAKAVRYELGLTPGHRLPMILFVDGNHFLAALPGRQGEVVIVDPPLEASTVEWSGLRPRWHGEAVVVGLSDDEVNLAVPEG